MEATERQIIRPLEFVQKVGFCIVLDTIHIYAALLVTQRTTKRPATRRPTSKRNVKSITKEKKGSDSTRKQGSTKKKASTSFISIPVVLVILSALIAFFIMKRRRRNSMTENLLEEGLGGDDVPAQKPSTSKLEVDPAKEKFEQLKQKFNKPPNNQEDPEPSQGSKDKTETPGKVEASLIDNMESVAVFKLKTEKESMKKNPPPPHQSEPEISETKDKRPSTDNDITGKNKDQEQQKKKKNPPPPYQSKPEISETNDKKSSKDSNIITGEDKDQKQQKLSTIL